MDLGFVLLHANLKLRGDAGVEALSFAREDVDVSTLFHGRSLLDGEVEGKARARREQLRR